MIKVTKLIRTCSACPSQWEGETEDGRYLYIRYRWGRLRGGVYKSDIDFIKNGGDYNLLVKILTETPDGYMTTKEMMPYFFNILDFSKTEFEQCDD